MASTGRLLLDLARIRPERHTYGSSASQRADLYLPRGAGPHPVAIVLHGGSWENRYGKIVTRPVCTDLVRRGFAAWNVEYRRVGGRGEDAGGWPATFDDVAAALALLPQAANGRLDLSSVRMVGHSAGGQLAIWAAARAGAPYPIARVAALAAPLDLSVAEPARPLIGGAPEELPDRYDRADPMRIVPVGVPILLVHTRDDETVPILRSRRFADAARAAGDEVEYVELEEGGHRVHIDPRREPWSIAARWLTAAI